MSETAQEEIFAAEGARSAEGGIGKGDHPRSWWMVIRKLDEMRKVDYRMRSNGVVFGSGRNSIVSIVGYRVIVAWSKC